MEQPHQHQEYLTVNTRTRRLIAGVVLIAGVACAACTGTTPLPPTGGGTTTSYGPVDPMDPACTQTIQVRYEGGRMPCKLNPTAPDAAGRVAVGDSITWQLAMAGRNDVPFYGMMGYAATEWVAYVRQLPAGTCPIVLGGTNDASQSRTDGGSRGWNAYDETAWRALLDAGRGVVVLPWLLPPASELHRADIDRARAFIAAEATARGWAVVDWQPYATQPNVLEPDGIHGAHGPDSMFDLTAEFVAARNGVVAEAAARCPA